MSDATLWIVCGALLVTFEACWRMERRHPHDWRPTAALLGMYVAALACLVDQMPRWDSLAAWFVVAVFAVLAALRAVALVLVGVARFVAWRTDHDHAEAR